MDCNGVLLTWFNIRFNVKPKEYTKVYLYKKVKIK